jgi:predicted dehydrogenase
VFEFAPANQYTLQGDAVSRMIREGSAPEMTLEDSIANMRVLDAIFRSEREGGWQPV